MIREARSSDSAAAVALLRAAHRAAGFEDGSCGLRLPFSETHAARLFDQHLQMMNGFAAVLDSGETIGGILLAVATEHPFGPVWIARETVWWIDPDHRGRSAIAMLDGYEAWAQAKGCSHAGMAGMGDDPLVGRLYLRRGYLRAETHFLKAL